MRSHISSRIASRDSAVTRTDASLEPQASCHEVGQVVETSSHLSYCSLKWRAESRVSQLRAVSESSSPSKSLGCQEWYSELARHSRRLPSPSSVSWTSPTDSSLRRW